MKSLHKNDTMNMKSTLNEEIATPRNATVKMKSTAGKVKKLLPSKCHHKNETYRSKKEEVTTIKLEPQPTAARW